MSKRHFDIKIIVILGQTATGKSALAVKISKALAVSGVEAEIISADSRQVYKGLNIGTGKITRQEMRKVPHHLLDVVNPRQKFTVTKYQKLAEKKIKEIITRGKTPIICGGTGFYIDAVTKGIVFPEVPPNPKIRRELALVNDRALLLKLKKLDPERAKNIDPKNKARLIRAIEIAEALGKVPKLTEATPPYEFIKIGLYLPPEKLKNKIEKRFLARVGKDMLGEAKKLHKEGLSWKRMQELGLEYKYMTLYLQDKITKPQMFEKLKTEIYRYAKRQMTWFKRDKEIRWFDASEKDTTSKVEKLLAKQFPT